MLNGSAHPAHRIRVAVLTADAEFEASVRGTFGASKDIELSVTRSGPDVDPARVPFDDAAVAVVDVDANSEADVAALQRLMTRLGGHPPIVVVTQAFNQEIARRLLQFRIADFLVKPVAPLELVRACAQVARGTTAAEQRAEAQIYTFLPAAGGVGVTTLAIQSALLLLRSGSRSRPSTCLVDLDFQHGACADYLDLEPRLDLGEIEPRPERLDSQLLEVMLSHHQSGLALVAAPNRPAEMRSFDPDMVARLLDLVSARFDHVVIDMPRTWFSWTDNVLLGSNKLYIVTEMTVPGVRHARQLISAIRERLGEALEPRVIVNRYERRMFGPGLRRGDIEQALGGALAGTVPNNYRLVREAIDRGVPLEEVKSGNNITTELKRFVLPQAPARGARGGNASEGGLRGLFWARG